jgi:hypothetical protein
MSDLPRPTIEELFSKYFLEPSLRDIYVEGVFDREILTQYFKLKQVGDVALYEIDLVDISEERVRAGGLTYGNKQKVITLACALGLIDGNCSYRCIVDRDFDHWLENMQQIRRLVYTCYCDIESYFLSSDLVKHLLVTLCKCRIADWDLFYSSLLSILKSLYAVRLSDRRLGWCMNWLSFDRSIAKSNSEISWLLDDYLIKLLAHNRRTADRAIFDTNYAECLGRFEGDPRYFLRGHDFVELAAWIVKKFSGVENFSAAKAMERLLIASVCEVDEIGALIAA